MALRSLVTALFLLTWVRAQDQHFRDRKQATEMKTELNEGNITVIGSWTMLRERIHLKFAFIEKRNIYYYPLR